MPWPINKIYGQGHDYTICKSLDNCSGIFCAVSLIRFFSVFVFVFYFFLSSVYNNLFHILETIFFFSSFHLFSFRFLFFVSSDEYVLPAICPQMYGMNTYVYRLPLLVHSFIHSMNVSLNWDFLHVLCMLCKCFFFFFSGYCVACSCVCIESTKWYTKNVGKCDCVMYVCMSVNHRNVCGIHYACIYMALL